MATLHSKKASNPKVCIGKTVTRSTGSGRNPRHNRRLRLFRFCSTKIPLLTELTDETPDANPHMLAKYAAHVTSASFGAVTDLDLKLWLLIFQSI